MDDKTLYENALLLALRKHDDKRYGSELYMCHLVRVSKRCVSDYDKIVAILHDILEDTNTSYSELHNLFGSRIADDVLVLTRKEKESYFEYINRVKQSSSCAVRVKIADLKENLSQEHSLIPSLCQRYRNALDVLLPLTE